MPRTIADGLQAPEPGALTFEVNRRRVDEIVTVTDEEMVAAMVFLYDRLKLVAEPSGSVGIAALLGQQARRRDRTVGVILSGGNVGAARFAELVGCVAPLRLISKNVFSAAATSLSLEGRLPSTHAVSSSSMPP